MPAFGILTRMRSGIEFRKGGELVTLRDFIKKNRAAIDATAKRQAPNLGKLNDEHRRQWVLNDEGLYNQARREGVRI